MWVVTTESNMDDYDDQSVDTYTSLVATEEDAKVKVVSEYLDHMEMEDWFNHPDSYGEWSELVESRDEAFGKAAIFIKTNSFTDEEAFKAVDCLYQWFQASAPVLFAGQYCEQHFRAFYAKKKTEPVDSDWNAVIGTIEKISDLPF